MPAIDPTYGAIIISIVGLVSAVLVAKIAYRKADNTPAPAPRATLEDVSSLEEHLSGEIRALQSLLGDVIGQLSAKKSQVDTLRSTFLEYVATVGRSWGTTRHPPALTAQQEAALYDNDEPPAYNTELTRQALREHKLVTLRDNPPPASDDSQAPRRPRH